VEDDLEHWVIWWAERPTVAVWAAEEEIAERAKRDWVGGKRKRKGDELLSRKREI
jgi:hypothetical protein